MALKYCEMKIDDEIKAHFITPQHRALVNIRYTSNYLGNLQNNFMSKFDLSMPQFNILRILRGAKGAINVNNVKDRMIEKSPNTTRLMDKLVDKNLIERWRCNDDRRVVYVQLTEEGQQLLRDMDESIELLTITNINLTDEEAQLLSDLLDKIRIETSSHIDI
jgi:MarR family 2-MHQ and catechol resistance regulon transcriptional repressor